MPADPDLAQRHQIVEPGVGAALERDEPHEVGEARLVGQPVVDGRHEIARGDASELTDRVLDREHRASVLQPSAQCAL